LKDKVIDFDDRAEARKALRDFGYVRKAPPVTGGGRS